MDIIYKDDVRPTAQQVIELYDSAKLPRPTYDANRIELMYKNSNLVISAWYDDRLVGVSRTITDWVWSAYLADLAISPDHQKLGIGKKLVDITREKLGELSMLLLLSVPTAFEYYPKIGFTKEDRAFMIPRVK